MQTWRLLRRLAIDDEGAELAEYAVLLFLVALVTLPVFVGVEALLQKAYVNWNTALMKCSDMPEPGKGGGC